MTERNEKRILFVHEKCGRDAGAEQNLLLTAEALHPDYHLELLASEKTSKGQDIVDRVFDAVHLVPFSQDEKPLHKQLSSLLNDRRPDLIYMHKCLSIPVMEAVLDLGIPIVRMVHDHEVYCMRTYKYFPWSREVCHKKAGPCCIFPCLAFLKRDRNRGFPWMSWVSYPETQKRIQLDQQFDRQFVVTTYMRDELLLQGYAADRIIINPPAPQTPKGVQVPPQKDRDLDTLLFVGQIIRGKGVDCLLKAVAKVQNPCKLLIVGEGSHRSYCEKLATQLGISHKVHFEGYVPFEQVLTYYNRALAGVVPSVWPEPIATVGLEMMHYGLPVVGFDSGGISDWLIDGETGYLIPWMDVTKMAEKIDLLLSQPDLAYQLGCAGQQLVRSDFSFASAMQRIKDTFEELLIKQPA